MHKKNIKQKNELPVPIKNIMNILISCCVGVLITLLLTLLFSFILSHSQSLTKFTGVYFVISVNLGGLLCGYLSTKLLKFKGIISGLLSSIPYSFMVVLLMIILSKQILNVYSLFFVLGIIIATTLGGIISANTKRRK